MMSRSTDEEGMDEAVSALVDGELPRRDSARVLGRIEEDPALRARWRRYHALRAALTGEMVLSGGRTDLAERVSVAIHREQEVTTPAWRRVSPVRSALRARSGMIALVGAVAVVTAAALIALPERMGESPVSLDHDQPNPVRAVVVEGRDADPYGTDDPLASGPAESDQLSLSPDLQQRFGMYLMTHAEYSALGELPGVMPYSRVAGYNAER